MKRALVTGGAGFLGRHFIAELRSGEYGQIVSVDVNPMNVNIDFSLAAHLHVVDDMLNFLEYHPETHEPFDLIIHCAAVSPHRVGIDQNRIMFIQNLLLDSTMFEWAVRTRQGRVLYISSSAIYPAKLQMPKWWGTGELMLAAETGVFPGGKVRNYIPLSEDVVYLDALAGFTPPWDDYGWTKIIGEKMATAARQCGVPVTVVRPFSGYGEDQSTDFPFPAILDRARYGDLTVWGPPGQTRDWIHVDDIVAGALAVAESGTEDPVNLCTGIATELGKLAQEIHWQVCPEDDVCTSSPLLYDETKPAGVFSRVGDPGRMRKYYTPKVTLDEGIRRALAARR